MTVECLGAIQWEQAAIVGPVAAALTAGVFGIVIAIVKRKKASSDGPGRVSTTVSPEITVAPQTNIDNKPSNVFEPTVKIGLDEKDVGQEVSKAVDQLRQDMASFGVGINALSEQLAMAQLAPKQSVSVSASDPAPQSPVSELIAEGKRLADAGSITEAELRFASAVAAGRDIAAFNEYGHFLRRIGRLTHAQAMYERVVESAAAENEPDLWRAIGYGNLGLIHQTRGELDEAERMHRKALAINEHLGRLEGMANAYGNLGLIHQTRGELDEAERMLRKALAINEQLGRLEGVANQYGNLGLIHQTRGELDEAERMHRKSLAIEKQLGRLEGMASDYGNLGVIQQRRGELDEAERMLRKALEIEEQLGRLEGMASDYGNLGVIHQTRGELDEAERMLRKALEIEEQLGRLEGMANAYANLGSVQKQRGDIAGAREQWTKARDLYDRIGMPQMVAKVQGWIDALPDEPAS